MKKFIAVILILMMTPFAALAQEIYKDTTTTQITKGVTLTTVRKFYGSYSLNINSIEADLTNKDLSLELLKNEKGIDKTDTVLNLAKKDKECLEYVIIHELCHLIEFNHGKNFKKIMNDFCPNWKEIKERLNS